MTPAAACPVCGGRSAPVLDLGLVPLGSCVLLADRDAALTFPTGPLRLVVCEHCGLIRNDLFDEAKVDYLHGYEESQACSPTFLAYSDELIDLLDRRHRLAGATVLEPGCGKGEFLVRLCERVGCRGIGVDPAHVPGRIETGADVTFLRKRFTDTSGIDADLVVCRHTLEHVGDVVGFLGALAESARRRTAPVVVEVPESQRILDEGAFWDVYYEHASYFTSGSLLAAAAAAGLAPDHLDVMYAGQYLVLDARPGPGASAVAAGSAPGLAAAVARFADVVPQRIAEWRRLLASAERPVLWGASSKAVGFLSGVGAEGVELAVDINPHKHGSFLAGSGVRIGAPEELREHRPDLVVVMNPVYRHEVASMIGSLGVDARLEVCG